MQRAEGKALEDFLPHRGTNLIIDAVEIESADKGHTSLRIARGDALGRDVILRRGPRGEEFITEVFLVEHLALGAICVLRRELPPGHIFFFSSILNFDFAEFAKAGEELSGTVSRKKDRGAFRRFEARLSGEGGREICSGEIMAYTAPIESARGEPTSGDEPPRCESVEPSLFDWKDERLILLDGLVERREGGARFSYRYPADHVFVPGHFPGNPVMMGVVEWQAMADAAWAYARACGLAGEKRFSGSLTKAGGGGGAVADVKGLVMEIEESPLIRSVRRVSFRGMARPGDVLLIDVSEV